MDEVEVADAGVDECLCKFVLVKGPNRVYIFLRPNISYQTEPNPRPGRSAPPAGYCSYALTRPPMPS
jgi:hypothetical protein